MRRPGTPPSPVERARPLSARMYVRTAAAAERRGASRHRRRMLEGLSGVVVEVGAGHGLNFHLYPDGVSEVLAIEPEPRLRAAAQDAAKGATVPVRVLAGVADDLPLEDDSVDAVVASLVLCSVVDQGRALDEFKRVLRAGGELRFYEHVTSEHLSLRWLQRAADATVWPLLAGGCHLGRDTMGTLRGAGFDVEVFDRFPGEGVHAPPKTFIVGGARCASAGVH